MNMTLNSLAQTPAAPDAAPVTAAVPAVQPGANAVPSLADAAPAAFAQWLGLGRQADAAALLSGAATPAAEGDDAPATDAVDGAGQASAPAQQDVVLLAAMSMPLMAPAAPAFIGGAGVAPAAAQGAAQGAARATGTVALPLTAAELRTGLATAALPAAGVSIPPSAMARSGGAGAGAGADALPAGVGAQSASADTAPAAAAAAAQPIAAQPVAAQPVAAQPVAAQPVAAQAMPAQPATGEARGTAPAAAAAADAKPADVAQVADDSAPPAAERPAGAWGVGTAASASARVPADSVALAGPPTAWRQTLHEALGERLNLQLTNRAEQAVIRLEPPMLGRVDIAIRHSAGALEVTISATHNEVLRQLHTVSENLRNDLAQRQFTDVVVTVAQAARGAQAAPHGDQQGRGRQPARDDQAQDPGRALAEATDPSATFSLYGRA